MTRKTALWFVVIAVILLMLGSASVILDRNAQPGPDVPTGLLH